MAGETIIPAAPLSGGRGLIASSFQFAFTGEDALQITTLSLYGAFPIELAGRWLAPDGSISVFTFQHTPAFPSAWQTTFHPIGVGYLLNATLRVVGGAPDPGTLFARVDVVRGGPSAPTVLGTLIQGYITARQWRAWPGSPIQDASEGPPAIKYHHLGAFAAGTEARWGVPFNTRWSLLAVKMILVTSGVAGTRFPMLTYTDPNGNELFRSGNPGSCGAGATATFEWAVGMPLQGLASPNAFIGGLLAGVALGIGFLLQTLTSGLQAGDHWDSGDYLVEERVDGS